MRSFPTSRRPERDSGNEEEEADKRVTRTAGGGVYEEVVFACVECVIEREVMDR